MIVDYHVHTYLCGHARGSLSELVLSAIEKGFSEIGIADHMPLTYTDDRTLSMAFEDLPFYVEQVLKLKEEFKGRIKVKLGIEADYEPRTFDKIKDMIDSFPFDYVIGSVHVIDDWIFDDPRFLERYDEINLAEFYAKYFDLSFEMVETGAYDILAHADLPKKFGKIPDIDLTPYYRKLLSVVRKMKMSYEVNTAGLRWPVREIYPASEFVRIASDMRIPVTLGSDSHCPEDVGKDFEKAIFLIRKYGYKEIATYEGRKMKIVPLG